MGMQITVDLWYRKVLSEGALLLWGYLKAASSSNALAFDIQHNTHNGEQDESDYEQMQIGWFPFSCKRIMEELKMTQTRQQKYMNELIRKKKIKVKRCGLPPRRWVFLIESK